MAFPERNPVESQGHWPSLLCLGTVHYDPAGYSLLLSRLEILQPDLIFVELSPFGRRFRRRRQRDYLKTLAENLKLAARRTRILLREALKHPEIDAIRRQICSPFEYRAARCFAGRRGIPVVLVDHSPFSMRCILQWPTLIDPDNIKHLLKAPIRRLPVPRQYQLAHTSLSARGRGHSEPILLLSDEELHPWNLREHHMAAKIIRHLQVGRALRPVFIGGWQHLSAGGRHPTLRSLLSLSGAQCFLLRTQTGLAEAFCG
jgi:hypothetical protein